jgi:hypothetical protein
MMSRDDRREIAGLLPEVTQERLPVDRRHLLKEHVMSEIRTARSAADATPGTHHGWTRGWARSRANGGRRGRAVTAVIASAAAMGAAATLVLTHASNTGGASPAAVILLDKIAVQASHQHVPVVRDDQFWYIKSWVAWSSCDGATGKCVLEQPHERQVWLSVSDLCKGGLLREYGSDTSLTPTGGSFGQDTTKAPAAGGPVGQNATTVPASSGPGGNQPTCPQPGSINGPTYRYLQTLPTDPHALLNVIYQQMQGQQPKSEEAFTSIGDAIEEAIAPPAVSAALYRAAALIPGVTVVPDVTNALGHHGVAVAFDAQGVREEWIFDKQTLQFIGERNINLADGSINGESAILQRAFVDHIGEVPHP